MSRNYKRNRIRWAVLGLAFGTVVISGLWRAWPREPALTVVARPAPVDSGEVIWINGHQRLVVTTESQEEDGTKQGDVPARKGWIGDVQLCDLDTGTKTEMPGLTNLFQRTIHVSNDRPGWFQMSPDRLWLVWHTYAESGEKGLVHAAHLDGSHHRAWTNYKNNGVDFFWDFHHFVQMPFGEPIITVLDLSDATKDQQFSTVGQAQSALGPYSTPQPEFVTVSEVDQQGNDAYARIDTYRAVDRLQVIPAGDDQRSRTATPIQTRDLKLPTGASFFFADVSPQQSAILYDLRLSWTNPISGWLHQLYPKFDSKPVVSDSLWVSRIDGSGLHEIGGVPFTVDEDNLPISHLERIEWLPDGKHVQFDYDGTYIVSAEPDK